MDLHSIRFSFMFVRFFFSINNYVFFVRIFICPYSHLPDCRFQDKSFPKTVFVKVYSSILKYRFLNRIFINMWQSTQCVNGILKQPSLSLAILTKMYNLHKAEEVTIICSLLSIIVNYLMILTYLIASKLLLIS